MTTPKKKKRPSGTEAAKRAGRRVVMVQFLTEDYDKIAAAARAQDRPVAYYVRQAAVKAASESIYPPTRKGNDNE